MKKIVFILGIMILSGTKLNAQPPVTDTLQWLKTNIEQRKNLFINKPLSVLLDSLKELKSGIIEYLGPEWYSVGNLNDTIWTKGINLYKVRFTQPVIFLRKWWSYNSDTFAFLHQQQIKPCHPERSEGSADGLYSCQADSSFHSE